MYASISHDQLEEDLEFEFGGKRRARIAEKKDAKNDRKIARVNAKESAKTERAALRANGTAPSFMDKAGGILTKGLSVVGGILGKNTESVDISSEGVSLKSKIDENEAPEASKFTKILPFVIGGVVLLVIAIFVIIKMKKK